MQTLRLFPIATILVTLLVSTMAQPALAAGPLGATILLEDTTPALRALRDGIVGFVQVSDTDGTVAGATVTVTIIRKLPLVGNVQSETHEDATAASGWMSFSPSAAFSVPGEYFVIVRATSAERTVQATTTYFVE